MSSEKVCIPGHPRSKQSLDSVLFPVQFFPPFCGGGLEHVLVRVIAPCPHVTLQGVHADQPDQAPSTLNTR